MTITEREARDFVYCPACAKEKTAGNLITQPHRIVIATPPWKEAVDCVWNKQSSDSEAI